MIPAVPIQIEQPVSTPPPAPLYSLFARALGGDPRALQQFFIEIRLPVDRTIRGLVRGDGPVDDLVQTTLEKIARMILRGRLSVERAEGADGPVWKYVLTAARRVTFEYFRTLPRSDDAHGSLTDDDEAIASERWAADSAEEQLVRAARERAAFAAVQSLEEPFRTAVSLWAEGLSFKQIADIQGTMVNTAKSRVARALEKARGRVEC